MTERFLQLEKMHTDKNGADSLPSPYPEISLISAGKKRVSLNPHMRWRGRIVEIIHHMWKPPKLTKNVNNCRWALTQVNAL